MTDLFSPDTPAAKEYATVYVAWELSKASWKLGIVVPGAERMSCFAVKGGDLAGVAARLAAARAKAGRSGLPVRVLSCYEARFDGHWLHRWLEGRGVISHEVDPSSIEVNRRARRANTDRLERPRSNSPGALVHWQRDSALTRWFKARTGDLRGRPRRIAIVAVARKLLVALWRYLETGVVPEGAVLHPSF